MDIVLDNYFNTTKPIIYAVDGVHGTLTELSIYFNVDPISVSDLMVDGYSISDAIILADSIKKTEKVAIVENISDANTVENKSNVNLDSVSSLPVSVDLVQDNPVNTKDSSFYKTHTDVQDVGDYIIVTTTTTTIYRKDS